MRPQFGSGWGGSVSSRDVFTSSGFQAQTVPQAESGAEAFVREESMMEGGSSLVCFMSEVFCRFCSFSGIRVNSLVELVPGLWFPGLWVRLVPMKKAVIVGTSIQRCLLPARLTRAEREEWLGF